MDGENVRLTLSGRLAAEHLVELRRVVEDEGGRGALAIDLHQVTLVDRDAVEFLARCEGRGATLEGCPAYVRQWIKAEDGRRSKRGKTRNRGDPGHHST